MTNLRISDKTSDNLRMLSEVQEQIKVLNDQKSNLQATILADLGMAENAPLGTTSFEDDAGSVRVKVATSDELVVDDDKLSQSLKALSKAGLMDTVVTVSYKVDKRSFEKLPDAKKSLLEPCISYKRKKPTLTVV